MKRFALRWEIGNDEAKLGGETEGREAAFVEAHVSFNPHDYSALQGLLVLHSG